MNVERIIISISNSRSITNIQCRTLDEQEIYYQYRDNYDQKQIQNMYSIVVD